MMKSRFAGVVCVIGILLATALLPARGGEPITTFVATVTGVVKWGGTVFHRNTASAAVSGRPASPGASIVVGGRPDGQGQAGPTSTWFTVCEHGDPDWDRWVNLRGSYVTVRGEVTVMPGRDQTLIDNDGNPIGLSTLLDFPFRMRVFEVEVLPQTPEKDDAFLVSVTGRAERVDRATFLVSQNTRISFMNAERIYDRNVDIEDGALVEVTGQIFREMFRLDVNLIVRSHHPVDRLPEVPPPDTPTVWKQAAKDE